MGMLKQYFSTSLHIHKLGPSCRRKWPTILEGDRIVAVGSSVGDIMWPVSTVEGVVSACTARLPGQTVTMRFQRPMENLRLGTADDECTVADEPMVVVASSTAVAPTPTKTTTAMTYEQEKQLLQRRCDVLKRYWSDSKTDFVGRNDIPALVADKVVAHGDECLFIMQPTG
jgi:hypothetical protein